MQGLFAELAGFDANRLNDVKPVVKQYKPIVSLEQVTNKPKDAQIESYDGEKVPVIPQVEPAQNLPTPTLTSVEQLLLSLGISTNNVTRYAGFLEDAGFFHADDLLLEEPSEEALEGFGIDNPEDIKKISYFIHPENAPRSVDTQSEVAKLISTGSIDPELAELIQLKQEYDTLMV